MPGTVPSALQALIRLVLLRIERRLFSEGHTAHQRRSGSRLLFSADGITFSKECAVGQRCCSLLPSCVVVARPQWELLTFLPDYRLHPPGLGFPGNSDSKLSPCNAGDPGSTPGWGRPPGEGNGECNGEGNPLSGLDTHVALWPCANQWDTKGSDASESQEDCFTGSRSDCEASLCPSACPPSSW